MNTLAVQTTAIGVLIFVVSLPLIYRKVAMNAFYGVRIPAAYQSDQRWYEINAYGGRLLARWSLLIVAAGVLAFLLPDSTFSIYHWVVFCIAIISLIAPLVQVVMWAGRPPKA